MIQGISDLPLTYPHKRINPAIPPWTYLLISHYLGSLNKNSSCSRQLIPFERLCEQKFPQNHLTSTIQNLLFTDYHPNDTLVCKAWARDLSLSLTLEDWEQIYLNFHKGSVNVSTQENGYKIQSRWYCTPALSTNLHQQSQKIAGDVIKNVARYYISGGHDHVSKSLGKKYNASPLKWHHMILNYLQLSFFYTTRLYHTNTTTNYLQCSW